MQHGGMQIPNMDSILHGAETEVISRAVNLSTLDPSPCEPNRKPPVVVVSSQSIISCSRLGQFHRRGSAKFPATDDQSIFEQAESFEI